MELASKMRWVLVIFVMLFVLVLIGWGLSAVARSVFSRGDSNQTATQEAVKSDLTGVRVVRYVVDGPVVASAEHRRYAIEVSPNVVMMRVYSDYGQNVLTEKSYQNNPESFATFMSALETANATARFSGTTEEDDEADNGVCPEGRRFIIEIGADIRRWTTSCDRNQGTAAGKMTTMRKLFARQVPDFDAIVKDTGLNRQ